MTTSVRSSAIERVSTLEMFFDSWVFSRVVVDQPVVVAIEAALAALATAPLGVYLSSLAQISALVVIIVVMLIADHSES